MKKIILCISIIIIALFLPACQDFLEIQPLDRVSGEQLFSTEAGVKTVLATIYNKIPMEDFNYAPQEGFNFHGFDNPSRNLHGGWGITSMTDEALVGRGFKAPGSGLASYWAYQDIRQVNQFIETVSNLSSDILRETEKARLISEAHFVRAYIYFAMARRYGGVPLITEAQEMGDGGDNSYLYVPRDTEKETYDFILDECDLAIANMPPTVTAVDGALRATKWTAYALKSRVALHAASLAKYWNEAPLLGEAVDAKLVGGMTMTDANDYYLKCINASKEVIDNSGKQLYKANPANREEAAKNYQTIFETPEVADIEILFRRGYIDGSQFVSGYSAAEQGHSTDLWFLPQQVKIGAWIFAARYWVTLDLVDVYEDYTDDGNGNSAIIKTRTDGNENYVVADATNMDINDPYIYYENQYEPFADKDARLKGTVTLPGDIFKGTLINMQGGLIAPDGTKIIFSNSTAVGLDGKTYYGFGAESPQDYSAFANQGQEDVNYTSTGFALKKFLQEAKTVNVAEWSSTQSFIDFRLAEIYLNYAEAAIESGQGDAELAKTYLNALRKRAAHTDEIPATLSNIWKERQVELALEPHRYWDLVRTRRFHTIFNNTNRGALVPILDLRMNPPKYVFVRSYNYVDRDAGGITFDPYRYYHSIPGVATSNLIQNPQY